MPTTPPSTKRRPSRSRSESPIFLSSSALTHPPNARHSRRRFLDDLATGAPYPGMPRPICSPDQLTEVQLKTCFDLLHACGRATDEAATLETTRASVDGFLDAVFRDWRWDGPEKQEGGEKEKEREGVERPELEFVVEAGVVAGTICTDITASLSYSCNPPTLKLDFTTPDPLTQQPQPFCPLARPELIRWRPDSPVPWRDSLRKTLAGKMVSKLHRHNKHLAVWHARKLIRGWSRGSVCLGPGVGEMGFVGREAVCSILGAL
ncbi:hypothetical protein E4U41_000133 [Claviceps citrina]|nr:hypothetical protein E4U41_000133 [Claviceps citrina]